MKKIHKHLTQRYSWYNKWHEHPHHGKIHYGVLFVFLAIIIIPFFHFDKIGASPFIMTNEQKSQFANLNGLHLLKEGEYAVIFDNSKSSSGQNFSHFFQLKSGEIIKQNLEDNLIASVIEYEEGKDVFIPANNTNIKVYNIYNIPGYDESGKIEKAVSKKLKNTGKVSVIVEMNLPHKRFYDPSDSPSTRSTKAQAFSQGRLAVVSSLGNNGSIKRDLKVINGLAVEIKNEKALEALAKSPKVSRVTLDRELNITLDTSVAQINAPAVYGFVDQNGQSLTGHGMVVAVLDTGVDYTHTDMGGCLGPNCKVIGGYNFIHNNSNPMDDNGHGTHIAATIAGRGYLDGVAPDAKILAYKVCNASGSCPGSAMISAIQASMDPNGDNNTSDRADVLNMSIGGYCGASFSPSCGPDDPVSLAIDAASLVGVTSAISAGNSGPGPNSVTTPGVARSAITVAAACKPNHIGVHGYCQTPIAYFSSRGPSINGNENLQKPDISAPGVGICAARASTAGGSFCANSGQHISLSGTSMSSPHIAGVIALVRQANPSYTPDQVKQQIKSTATSLGGGLSYNDQGAGLVNVSAAIPLVSEVKSNPSLLRITTNPTQAIYTFTQNFTSTALNNTIGTVTIDFSSSETGITFSSNKTTLNLSNLGTETFTATFSVNNNTVKSGSYSATINFYQNGVRKGVIPVHIVVVPTVTASPVFIDYGNFNPNNSSWQSGNFPIVFTNKRTDAPQTLTLSSSDFPSGATYSFSPTTITIPAGGTATVNTSISATNGLALGMYNGVLNATNTSNNVSISLKFSKFHNLKIQDSNVNGFNGAMVALGIRNSNTLLLVDVLSNPFDIYFPMSVTADFVIRYPSAPDGTGYLVLKEEVYVNGSTSVTVSKSEAKNLVKLIATDKNNQSIVAGWKFVLFTDSLTRKGRIKVAFIYPNQWYSSNVTNSTNLEIITVPLQASIPEVYMFGGIKTGLSSNWTITNTSTDLKQVSFRGDNNLPEGTIISPTLYSCIYPNSTDCWAMGSSGNAPIREPGIQTLYSTRPPNYFVIQSSNNEACSSIPDNCQIEFGSPFIDVYNNVRKINLIDPVLPWITPDKIFNGLGPQILFAKIITHFGDPDVMYFSNLYWVTNFLRQDYSRPASQSATVTLKKNGSTVAEEFLGDGVGGAFSSDGTVHYILNVLPKSPNSHYELTVPYTYKIKGQNMNALYKLKFNSGRDDPDSPYMTRLYFFTQGIRSEQYDASKRNTLSFDLNPNGGAMGTVTVKYSTNGTSFVPIQAIPINSGSYEVDIPSIVHNGKIHLVIEALDVAGNSFEFSFQLPAVGQAQVDETLPTVSITSPVNGATLTGTVTVSANATDNIGVTLVEFYKDSDTTPFATSLVPPYTASLDTTTMTNGSHILKVKAYDAAGNSATSEVSITVNNTVSPPGDTAPPTVSITSPVSGATLTGTVTVSANATDNIGIDHVDFYQGNTLIGASSNSPHQVSWNTASVSNGTYSLTAKAYDTSGNSNTSSPVSVTVSNSTPLPPDTTPPTVSITSPTSGSTVSGQVTLTASASDNVGVTKVTFYRGSTIIDTDTTGDPDFSVSWNTTSLANGSYTLTAKAEDSAGNVGTSSRVTVTVSNNAPPPSGDVINPTVSITSPAQGSIINRNANIQITASATDNIGVTKVEFYTISANPTCTVNSAPYVCNWRVPNSPDKTYTLTAKAYDTAGNVGVGTVTVKSNK